MYKIFLSITLTVFCKYTESKIIPDVQGVRPCPEYKHDFDFSNLDYDYDDDGYLTVNGNFTFLRDIASPYPAYFHSEQMERGEWRRALIERSVPDFCAVLQSPTEIWYPITRYLNKKACPYKAGFVGTIDHVRYKFPFTISPQFLGEWRLFMEQRDSRKDPKPFACLILYFSVIEI
ncbi:uncharacterized protein LOC134210020 [Armigeres subalbatus]|uniref:uncharacterized protein LOC134210020 n=1 Tax=Armigeres subalbatus TaxID=124917 RepID=UPI002ED2F391